MLSLPNTRAIEDLTLMELKTEPDLCYVGEWRCEGAENLIVAGIIQVVSCIVQSLQKHFQFVVVPPPPIPVLIISRRHRLQLPLISSQPTVHREVLLKRNEFFSVLELKANSIVLKESDAIVSYLAQVLGRHKRTDFRIKVFLHSARHFFCLFSGI